MKIENLEKLKTNQKMKYEEKESIYEKMVMKNMRELWYFMICLCSIEKIDYIWCFYLFSSG